MIDTVKPVELRVKRVDISPTFKQGRSRNRRRSGEEYLTKSNDP